LPDTVGDPIEQGTMKVEILALCDYARGESNGKLYIIGAFDRIFATQEPVNHALCALAARIRFESLETGVKNLSVSFVDSDGAKIMPGLSAQINVQMAPDDPSATVNFVLIIPQISFPKYGEYSIDFAVDSRIEGSIPVYVQAQPPSAAQGRT
jgi:hypothetical protein